MATTEILQEYLTKLGFAVDAVSYKKITDALTTTEKHVLKVGAGVSGMVVAVEAGVAAFAYQMEKMYYASKLNQSTVKSLMSVEMAGKQIGIAGASMEGAIHGMAQALRLNPGLQGLIESFGIKVTGRDVSQVMLDYVRALKTMPEYVGAQYAGIFGMDPDTYHLMVTQLDTLSAKQKENLALFEQYGIDPDKAAETMKNYTNSLRDTENRLEILGMVLADKFSPEFQALNEIVQDSIEWWVEWAHGQRSYTEALKDTGEYLASLYPVLVGNLNKMLGIYDRLNAGGQWIDELLGLHNVFGGGEDEGNPDVSTGKIKYPTATGGSRNDRNFNPGNMRYGAFAKAHGATGADEAGFAIFPNIQTGYLAQKSLLSNYGSKGLNTVDEIVSRWAPSSENNTSAYVADVSKQMGVGANQALNLNDPETMSRLSLAMAKHEGASPSTLASLGNTRLGGNGSLGSSVTLQQQTNINVHGTDASATANMVAMKQTRVNGDIVRNLQGRTG